MVCTEVEGITASLVTLYCGCCVIGPQQWHNHSHSGPVEPVDWEVIPRGGHSNATAHYPAGLEAGNWVVSEYFAAELMVHADWADVLSSTNIGHINERATFALFIHSVFMLYLQYFLCFIPEIHLVLCCAKQHNCWTWYILKGFLVWFASFRGLCEDIMPKMIRLLFLFLSHTSGWDKTIAVTLWA